jgi:uncharacterized membrane protein
MSNSEGVLAYIGTYPDDESARADYDVVRDLYRLGAVGTFDVALVVKDEDGTVHVHKVETATQHGAWGGAAAGALVGILFPPAIVATAIVGAAAGAISGHLWRGLSRGDVAELGDVIDAGQAALVIVGAASIQGAIEDAELRAERWVVKVLDVPTFDLDQAVDEAADELG